MSPFLKTTEVEASFRERQDVVGLNSPERGVKSSSLAWQEV